MSNITQEDLAHLSKAELQAIEADGLSDADSFNAISKELNADPDAVIDPDAADGEGDGVIFSTDPEPGSAAATAAAAAEPVATEIDPDLPVLEVDDGYSVDSRVAFTGQNMDPVENYDALMAECAFH